MWDATMRSFPVCVCVAFWALMVDWERSDVAYPDALSRPGRPGRRACTPLLSLGPGDPPRHVASIATVLSYRVG